MIFFPYACIMYICIATLILFHGLYNKNEDRISALLLAIVLLLAAIALALIKMYWVVIVILSGLFGVMLISIFFIIRLISTILPIKMRILTSDVKSEIARKIFHSIVLILILPGDVLQPFYKIGVNYLNTITPDIIPLNEVEFLKVAITLITGSLIPIFVIIEFQRIYLRIGLLPSNLLRESEKKRLASYLYTTASIFFISLLVPQNMLIASIGLSLLADAAAAIVGKKFGRFLITENRSVEGCLAGFLVGFLFAILFVPPTLALISALFIEITDVLNTRNINDNLLFPIISALTMWAVSNLI